MQSNKDKAKLIALISIIFFSVSGGPYGLEEIVTSVGPINTLFLILFLPVIWTIPETMIIAELSSTYPIKGGYYKWVQMGLGRFWGFLEGWWSILYTLIDLSLYPVLFTLYLKHFFPELGQPYIYFIQLLMIWSSAIVNILGIRIVGNILSYFQYFILLFFIIFVVCGIKYLSFDFSHIFSYRQDFTVNNLIFGLSLAFWNFIGWDNGSTLLHEVDNPKMNYHKALFITIPIVVLFYIFPLLIGLNIHTDWKSWKFGEFSAIAATMHYPFLAFVLAIGGMVTCLGLFNSLLLSSTRVFSTMSEDRLLPEKFSKLHSRFKTPYVSICFAAFIFSIMILIDFKNLIVYDVFLYLIAILLEALALVSLRKMNSSSHTHFKIPFGNFGLYMAVGMVFLVVVILAIINIFDSSLAMKDYLFGIFLILSGVPVYLWHEKFQHLGFPGNK